VLCGPRSLGLQPALLAAAGGRRLAAAKFLLAHPRRAFSGALVSCRSRSQTSPRRAAARRYICAAGTERPVTERRLGTARRPACHTHRETATQQSTPACSFPTSARSFPAAVPVRVIETELQRRPQAGPRHHRHGGYRRRTAAALTGTRQSGSMGCCRRHRPWSALEVGRSRPPACGVRRRRCRRRVLGHPARWPQLTRARRREGRGAAPSKLSAIASSLVHHAARRRSAAGSLTEIHAETKILPRPPRRRPSRCSSHSARLHRHRMPAATTSARRGRRGGPGRASMPQLSCPCPPPSGPRPTPRC
jgi:hypothetical protein